MTPKEKAQDLREKFWHVCYALTAVDEILEQLNHLPTQGYGMEYQGIINYWKEVKQEINNI